MVNNCSINQRQAKYWRLFKVHMKFFISLFERAFKVMKNGVYFIVIAFLFAELLDFVLCKLDDL